MNFQSIDEIDSYLRSLNCNHLEINNRSIKLIFIGLIDKIMELESEIQILKNKIE